MKNEPTVRHGTGGLFGVAAVVAAGGMLLAACGLFAPGEVKVCPRVSLLNDAESMIQYRDGPGRDLTDVLFEAKVVDVNWSCKYLDNRVRVEAVIDIVAQRGPASRGGNAKVWFFVGIIDYEQNIIAKQTFASEIEFRDGRRRAGVREEIEQILFLKEGEGGSDYEIIVGLQLTEQQLQQNRGRRR
jgi:hypothetical protein